MDLRKLKTLIDLVSESNIAELEITEADGKVRIVKATAATAPAMVAASAPATATAAGLPMAAEPAVAPPPVATGHVVKSPTVGTFYRSSTPGSAAFVDVGSEVREGMPLCIIEAMKIMNEIESDHTGTVTKICVENGQAVEFGQPLFIID